MIALSIAGAEAVDCRGRSRLGPPLPHKPRALHGWRASRLDPNAFSDPPSEVGEISNASGSGIAQARRPRTSLVASIGACATDQRRITVFSVAQSRRALTKRARYLFARGPGPSCVSCGPVLPQEDGAALSCVGSRRLYPFGFILSRSRPEKPRARRRNALNDLSIRRLSKFRSSHIGRIPADRTTYPRIEEEARVERASRRLPYVGIGWRRAAVGVKGIAGVIGISAPMAMAIDGDLQRSSLAMVHVPCTMGVLRRRSRAFLRLRNAKISKQRRADAHRK